jgi:hypothetical protein
VVWGWIDSIELQAGDLDHLVLPRKGGFVVIDSKWCSDGANAIEMAASARRARLRAEGLARTLLKSEMGSHRANGNTVSVDLWSSSVGQPRNRCPRHATSREWTASGDVHWSHGWRHS